MSPRHRPSTLRMKTVRTVAELRAALAPARREGLTIGLVPTMGALHEGHLSLIARAREQCDVVVVSLFVNPAQFNERSDLERYPRPSARRRARRGSRRGPAVRAVGRGGLPAGLRHRGRGAGADRAPGGRGARPEHFRGVTTVVTKLFCMAQPDVAYFGQKDAQQVVVIRRLVARPEPAGADRGLPDRARARRPCHVQPQRPAVRAGARARSRCRPRWAPPREFAARGRALGAGAARGRRAASCARPTWSPTTWRSSTPNARAPRRARGRACWRVPPGRRGPADRQRDFSPVAPRDAVRPLARKAIANAACDAQVQDPSRHGHRLRPALRGLDHDRPRSAGGRRHPRARAGPCRRHRQRRAL